MANGFQPGAALRKTAQSAGAHIQTAGTAAAAFARAAAKTVREKTRGLVKNVTKLGLTGAFAAATAFCGVVAVNSTVPLMDYSRSQNLELLNACNKAVAAGQACTPEGAAERARSRGAMKHIGGFTFGLFGGLGFGMVALDRALKKPGAPRKRA